MAVTAPDTFTEPRDITVGCGFSVETEGERNHENCRLTNKKRENMAVCLSRLPQSEG